MSKNATIVFRLLVIIFVIGFMVTDRYDKATFFLVLLGVGFILQAIDEQGKDTS